ncbi:MAG: hypothetical protein WDZ60_04650, partial [Wenzhouxiangellaceae bacterium]
MNADERRLKNRTFILADQRCGRLWRLARLEFIGSIWGPHTVFCLLCIIICVHLRSSAVESPIE